MAPQFHPITAVQSLQSIRCKLHGSQMTTPQSAAMAMPTAAADPAHLVKRLKDYAEASSKLTVQRQAIFFASMLLGVTYFEPMRTLICYGAIQVTEFLGLSS